jgi:hypothetical protein
MNLQDRVAEAADKALARQKFVSAVDVCTAIGWLPGNLVIKWQQGRVDSLEELLQVRANRVAEMLGYLSGWAKELELTATPTEHIAATRDRRQLRFTADGDPAAEEVWRVTWAVAELPAKQRERLSAPPDLVVIQPLNDWTCAECQETDDLLIMDSNQPLCMTCADMDHLLFLPAGDAALTRRAKKGSRLSAVVVRWSRSRKRYERRGLLVEEAALEIAEEQCLADEDARMRRRERDRDRRADQDLVLLERFAEQIRRLFPGCPEERAEAIAAHAAVRGSGRVGRSAAGRSLEPNAVRLAVVASIRHLDTDYDELLMSGTERADAREQIRPAIDEVLTEWESSPR